MSIERDTLKRLTVRISSKEKYLGSGGLYIHNANTAFVLTAAHVLNEVENEFIIECMPDHNDEEKEHRERYVFYVTRDDVTSEYGYNTFPTEQRVIVANDAAVIKLDISNRAEIKNREKAWLAPEYMDIEGRHVTGYGFPEGRNSVDEISHACTRYNVKSICDTHTISDSRITWKGFIDATDPNHKIEVNGLSGSILAIADEEKVIFAGINLSVIGNYTEGKHDGADMKCIRIQLAKAIKAECADQQVRIWQPQIEQGVVAAYKFAREIWSKNWKVISKNADKAKQFAEYLSAIRERFEPLTLVDKQWLCLTEAQLWDILRDKGKKHSTERQLLNELKRIPYRKKTHEQTYLEGQLSVCLDNGNVGDVLKELTGLVEDAEDDFEKVALRYQMGIILLECGQKADAQKEFESVVLDSSCSEKKVWAWGRIAEMHRDKNPSEALEAYKEIVGLYKDIENPDCWTQRQASIAYAYIGMNMMKEDEYSEAVKNLNKAITLADEKMYDLLGECNYVLAQYKLHTSPQEARKYMLDAARNYKKLSSQPMLGAEMRKSIEKKLTELKKEIERI